jgi:membrane-associated progesterone receptor component
MAPLLLVTGIPILSIVVGVFQKDHIKDHINVFLMGFFRDLGRIKANKRRNRQSSNAMVAMDEATPITSWDIFFGRDDPLAGIDFSEVECNNSNATDCTASSSSNSATTSQHPTFTAKELEEFGSGKDRTTPIQLYLSVFGRVYDVSQGEKFYGPDANYAMFAGKDVTRALCLGCKEPECLVRSTEGLSDDQIKEGKRWLSFFHTHDKYHYVGSMESLDSEAWLDALIEDAIVQRDDEENTQQQNDSEQ